MHMTIGIDRIDRNFVWLVLIVCGLHPGAAFGQQAENAQVDFEAQIAPILKDKCYSCHGPLLRSGGLRLDRRDEVLVGGYSQKPLVGGTLETNEIYQRISSNVPAYRMPKGADPLTADEISLFKRWVEAGAPWPEMNVVTNPDEPDFFDQQAWLNYVERWLNEVPGFISWLICMLCLMLFLLFIERYKQASQKNRVWTTHRWFRWLKPLRGFQLSHFLLIVSVMGWILTGLIARGQITKARELADNLKLAQNQGTGDTTIFNSVYGNPPIPQRPDHPNRLRGEYYRGNCERSPKLFNGGNYRTGTLRVSLIDAQGRDVNYGDRLEPDSLSIRFELERPQGTTPTLYGDSIVKGVFLTPQLVTERPTKPEHPVTRLTEIKPGWKWQAIVPLRGPSDTATTLMTGLIYVYQGAVEEDQKIRGTLHYGIKYDLHLKQLILQPESQVWMGSLFWTSTFEHPIQGKVPLKEWFSDQPIPEITGENTTDPNLLGIPEHEAKLKKSKQ